MAVQLVPQVTFYATLARNNDYFTLDDPVRGALDSAFTLLSDIAYDVTPSSFQISIQRGRTSRVNEDIPPGQASIQFHNYNRGWDPSNASGEWFGNIVPGKRMTIAQNYVTIFDGTVEDWNFSESLDGGHTATAVVADNLGLLARCRLDSFTATSQTAGPRIGAVLDRDEVGFGPSRDLDDGVVALQADAVDADQNALEYLQLVAKSDFGYLFAARTGEITYRDRMSVLTRTPLVFDMSDPSGLPIHGLERSFGSETLFNRAAITRAGGVRQVADDLDSQTAYGVRALSIDNLLMAGDDEALGMAGYFVNVFGEPRLRVSALVVKLHALDDPYELQLMTMLDIGQPVEITMVLGGVTSVAYGLVEGVSDEILPAQHTRTLYLSDVNASFFDFLVLDDATRGELDTFRLSF